MRFVLIEAVSLASLGFQARHHAKAALSRGARLFC